jgi:beta-lactamase regulating signal transducer with metallopeptidase domain
MNIEFPAFSFLCKWTILLALGWTAHGLLRARDARWRLILWRSVLCFGLALPLLQFLPMPSVQVPVDKVAQMVSDTITLPASASLAPALPASAPAASHLALATSEVQNPSLIHATYNRWADFFPTLSWSDIVIAIWVVGALFGAIRLLRFLDQLAALRRAAVPASPAVQELTAEVLGRWQIRGSVLVLVSDSAVSPFAFGIFRPAIMLPAKMAQSLSSEEMAALLGHEVAHLRGRDLWWCVGWRWMKAIIWFHPLIWKLPDVHSLACEEEADRLASSYLTSRASYARLLSQLTLRVLALPELETQLVVNGTAQITHRLERLAKDLGPWDRKQTVGACFLVLAMALVSVGCDVNSKKNDRQIQALEAKVAELEHRLDEMQAASRQLTPEQRQGRARTGSAAANPLPGITGTPARSGQYQIAEGNGWNGFKLGATREELIQALGQPDSDSDNRWMKWKQAHVHCLVDDARGAFELRFDEGFQGPTTAGIRIGSPLNDALAAYGEPSSQKNVGSARKLLWDSKGILIWFHEDRAAQIVVFQKTEQH